jgi:hypothetical protein
MVDPMGRRRSGSLSLREFGRMMTTYSGWGCRIIFVPDDEVHREPKVEVKEPTGG